MLKKELVAELKELGIQIKDNRIKKSDVFAAIKKYEERVQNFIEASLKKVIAVDPSAKPPKKWWNNMYKKVKKNNPDYTEEQIRSTIGKIWYQNLTKGKRSEIRKREGKKLKK